MDRIDKCQGCNKPLPNEILFMVNGNHRLRECGYCKTKYMICRVGLLLWYYPIVDQTISSTFFGSTPQEYDLLMNCSNRACVQYREEYKNLMTNTKTNEERLELYHRFTHGVALK